MSDGLPGEQQQCKYCRQHERISVDNGQVKSVWQTKFPADFCIYQLKASVNKKWDKQQRQQCQQLVQEFY